MQLHTQLLPLPTGWLVHKQFGQSSIPVGMSPPAANSAASASSASLCFHAKLPAKLAFVPYPCASRFERHSWWLSSRIGSIHITKAHQKPKGLVQSTESTRVLIHGGSLLRQEADKYESDVAYVAFTRLVAPFCMITTALSLLQAGSPQVAFICEAWHIPLDSHQFPH